MLGAERVIGAYVVETEDGPALFDCGPASAVPALAGALSRRLRAPGFFNRLRRRKVEEDEFVVVFAGWLAAGHDGVLDIEPNPSGDRNLAEVAWRAPEELLAGDFRPASLLKLLDLGALPELSRPEP